MRFIRYCLYYSKIGGKCQLRKGNNVDLIQFTYKYRFDEEDYRILVQGAKFLPKIKEERKPLIYEAINIANDTGLNYKYTTTEDEIFIEGYYLIRILDNFNINILSRIMIEMQDRIKSDYEIFTKVMN